MALTIMGIVEGLMKFDEDHEVASMYSNYKNGKNVIVVCVRFVDDNGEHRTTNYVIEERDDV